MDIHTVEAGLAVASLQEYWHTLEEHGLCGRNSIRFTSLPVEPSHARSLTSLVAFSLPLTSLGTLFRGADGVGLE